MVLVAGHSLVVQAFPSLHSQPYVWAMDPLGSKNNLFSLKVTSGSNLLLASEGSTAWTSDGTPSGTTVYTVYAGSSHAQDYTLSIVGV